MASSPWGGGRKAERTGSRIDRVEHVNLNELFERMSEAEMEAYAREGILPAWFKGALSATPLDSQDAENDD